MEIKSLSISFVEKKLFSDFSLTLDENKFVCILGKSGCGKTTLLNCISEQIPFDGKIFGVEKTSYVFQTPRLIPRICVRKNLEFVINENLSKTALKEKAENVAKQFDCFDLLEMFPQKISGGEAHKVALARAFCADSKTLLMDEPFENIDIGQKNQLITKLISNLKINNKTVICVSHNVEDVLLLADRIIIFGGQPNKIIFDKTISIPQFARKFGDKNLTELREEIYSAILSL